MYIQSHVYVCIYIYICTHIYICGRVLVSRFSCEVWTAAVRLGASLLLLLLL